MIKTLRAENVYNVIDTLAPITALAEVYSRKPDESSTPDWTYIYTNIISDVTKTNSNIGFLWNTARISFTIVCKNVLLPADTEERVLYDVMDAITNGIVNEWCTKIPNRDNEFLINSITEDSISPIFTDEMNRAYMVKTYLFNYMGL